ncbi:NADP-dependent 3-hydroxy acid dehydrogenase YdfG [Geodermatophilus tzadiensis]|uniref:NADP-dependent 3-hydroxy acid dehydrogenase YdfG n=1 Tax=Geodermatophilus tzadiensis TaxID=1137988 RepID=A0A2T0TSU3_9ACTN|nr:SDR family oxidoreductase [Geodermatophilus tzadiensis]PRY48721.1 NADP-dependent 3-hydroxy acid dehydrogenase YdfG [Geodermatophilus tzadiensis]
MQLQDAVVVVTGAGSGIGAALARRAAAEGAAAVVVSDRDGAAAERVAGEVGGTADATDVTDEAAVAALVERTVAAHGRVDLFCSNAGVFSGGGIETDTAVWEQVFAVNVLAHVYAARAVLPSMLERGSGHLLNVASAAGLLTTPGDAPYTVTKHGAVALAEWLAVTYGDRGIGVSCVCPLGVSTPLLMDPLEQGRSAAAVVAASGRVITPEDVAQSVVEGLADERFLILPHPEVATYWAQKAAEPERWLAGVRRLVRSTSG